MIDDFEAFKTDISWFVKPDDNVIIRKGKLDITNEFTIFFPILNRLIKQARLLDISINDIKYKLLSWTTNKELSCGWLCKVEANEESTIALLPEHQMLLDNIGGIKESYNNYSDGMFTNNQNFLFIKSLCKMGLSYSKDYYHEACEDNGFIPMPDNNLLSFVEEANGGQTLYNLSTKQVYLFSHDHSFDYVTFLAGQPKYTFHTINGINTFKDYVEALAQQWLTYLSS